MSEPTYNGVPLGIIKKAHALISKHNLANETDTFKLAFYANEEGDQVLLEWAIKNKQGMATLKIATDKWVGGYLADGETDQPLFDD